MHLSVAEGALNEPAEHTQGAQKLSIVCLRLLMNAEVLSISFGGGIALIMFIWLSTMLIWFTLITSVFV